MSLLSSGGSAEDVGWLLLACYLLTLIFSKIQLARLYLKTTANGLRKGMLSKVLHFLFDDWLMQKQMFVLVSLGCASRIIFLICASYVWDSSSGDVEDGDLSGLRTLFYISDIIPIIVIFLISSTISLYWSELYYIAQDNMPLFISCVKPLFKATQVILLVGLFIFTCLITASWQSDLYYILLPVALFISILYIASCILLFTFAKLTSTQIQKVPIEIQARKKKLSDIYVTTMIILVCMLVRSICLLYLANKNLPLDTKFSWVCTFLYFWGLEILPYICTMYYFHRMPSASTSGGLIASAAEDSMSFNRLIGGDKSDSENSAEMIQSSISRLSQIHFRAQQNEEDA